VLLPQLPLQGEYPCAVAKMADALHMRTLVQTRGWLLATRPLLKLHAVDVKLCPFTLQDA
jgi:hypothetical protein